MHPSIRYFVMSVLMLALTAYLYGVPGAFAQKTSKEFLSRAEDEEQLFVNAQVSDDQMTQAVAPTLNRSVSKGARQIVTAPQSFTNSNPITITDCPGTCIQPQPAGLYSSNITVSGVTTPTVQRVSVTLNGFSHAFPADVDVLLVSPSGRKSVIMSDFGAGEPGVSGINVTLDDYAATPIPSSVVGDTAYPFASGSYRPSNTSTSDVFPAPAPPSPYTYTLSAFNGDNPNGTWSLYVVDDSNSDAGSISGGWTITFDTRPAPPAAGDILISEFRTRGVGTAPPASDGSADEFIELYNNTDSSITIIDAVPGANPMLAPGAGWRFSIAEGASEVNAFILSETSSTAGPLAIPARGHYLMATVPTAPSPAGNTYSLVGYPTGTDFTTSGSANLSINPAAASGFIPDDAGIAIFNTTTATLANRLDSVGFSSVTAPGYKEGTGLAPANGITTASQHSFVRKYQTTGTGYPVDTNNNANDFVLVETTGAILNGVQSIFGAPGPERAPSATSYTTTAAPRIKPNSLVTPSLIDPLVSNAASPNRVRDATAVPNGALGTLAIRRCFTNNTGAPILTMRYRITDITTLGSPNPGGAQADLRVLDSAFQTVAATTGSVNSEALTLQTPPAQTTGGGLNSSLGEGVITATAPLASGDRTCVTFTTGVQQAGRFRFFINAESNNVLP
jgi:subtilisin-like proprotein convertase family protein